MLNNLPLPFFAFWPFASGWLLLWGLAAAVPIVIHLWNKRRYREMTWAAMDFLLAAVRKNARRIKYEQLLLLVTRVMILVFLAIGLAEPVYDWYTSLGSGGAGAGQTHVVLVIDGSYSMGLRVGEKSLFEQARDAAIQFVEQAPQGDGFSLVLMADPPQAVIAQPAFDPTIVVDELRNLRLPHGGASLTATIAEVEGIVRHAGQQHPRFSRQRVCFFSDLGKNSWEESADSACRARIAKLAEHASLALFESRSTSTSNVAVTRLATRESLLTVGRDVTMEVELQNFGNEDMAGRKLEFFVDGQRVAEKGVDIAAAGRTIATFSHRFDAAGEHAVEAIFRDDALSIDNHRWLALPVKETVRVLCVQGQPDEAQYLALALNPSKNDRPRVRAEVASESAVLETDLRPYDCVFLCNVGRFSRDEAGVLRDYLRGGGGLVFFLGDQVQAESYNTELGGDAADRRVLPARLEQTVSEAQYRFDPRNYRHPIVAPFRDQARAGLLTTPVWKYFRLAPYDKENAKVALAFDNGDPVIVEQSLFRGRSIVFATACSTVSVDRTSTPPTPWTALPTWPSFVPLMQETLALAVSGQNTSRNVLVGEALQGAIPSSAAASAVMVAGPAGADGSFGEGERVRLTDDGEERRWVFSNTQFSGLYREDWTSTQSSPAYYAVNVDTRESQLDRLDTELLPSQFHRTIQAAEASPASSTSGNGLPLFRYFLGAVFVLLLVESTLAWYFGNRR